jgi:hypothetical protein
MPYMIEREPGDTSPIFSERARGQMQTAVTRQSAGALRRGRRKAAAGRSGSGLTPLAAMVRKMLERDVPRDVIVTAIKAAERHAFVTLRHAPSHHSQSKAALRARRYRENKKAAASRDAQHAPSLSNNNIIKKERGRSTRVTLRDDFVPDWQSASSVGLTRVESEREFQNFKNHAQQHGKTCVDWQAAWSNWCIRAAEFLGKPPPQAAGHGAPPPQPPRPQPAPGYPVIRAGSAWGRGRLTGLNEAIVSHRPTQS